MFRSRHASIATRVAAALLTLACAANAIAATITGTVFEDRNYGGGSGRSMVTAGGTPLAGVRVELYRLSTGNLIDSATTNVNGAYSLDTAGNSAAQASDHIVRVVTGTVRSARTAGTGCTQCVPVQTYRTDASTGVAVAVTNRVGGDTPALPDAASNTTNLNYSVLTSTTQAPHAVAPVDPNSAGATLTGIDFGFNFDTIVNTRDLASCAPSGSGNSFFPCQGSLRQFIINSEALGGEGTLSQAGSGQLDGLTSSLPAGAETSIFMVPNGALSGGTAIIALAAGLPAISGVNTRLDATTQTVNIGDTNGGTLGTGGVVGVDNILLPAVRRPEVQLTFPVSAANCSNSPSLVTLSGSNQSINGLALSRGYILLSGSSGTARNNAVGMTASGSSTDSSPACFYGITFSGSNSTIRNNFVTVNNSAIRKDSGGANSTITLNEIAQPASGHTNTFDGILLINGATNITVSANLTRDQRGGGIELGFGAASDSYFNVTVTNNTVTNNGFNSGSSASTEPVGMAAYSLTGSNVVFSRNRVTANAGPGLLVMAATGVTATQNTFSNNGSIAIDLDPNTRDPNTMGAPNGVTLNDAGDGDTGPNGLLNYPVITSAIIANGELIVNGFARANALLELYLVAADPTGFGEGQTFLPIVLQEGSGTDLNATTGSYGPAAINGRAQGTDTTHRFLFRTPIPAGVSVGSILSSTATLEGQTSEFGGNVTVTAGPELVHLKSVAVFSDPLNNTTNPKSIPGAVETYTLRITNQGAGPVDGDSIVITDAIPPNTTLFVLDTGGPASGPVAFLDGSPASALTYTFATLSSTTDMLDFSNDGGATFTYTPVPDAGGYDANVTHIRVRPQGALAANTGAGNPYFEIRFRIRIN